MPLDPLGRGNRGTQDTVLQALHTREELSLVSACPNSEQKRPHAAGHKVAGFATGPGEMVWIKVFGKLDRRWSIRGLAG